MDDQNMAAIEAALQGIDPEPFRQEVARIDVDIAGIDVALKDAEAQLADLQSKSEQIARSGPDASSAAAALLDGGDVLDAAPSLDLIEERRRALHLGIRGLRDRRAVLVDEREGARDRFAAQIAATVEPVASALEAEARATLKRLADISATARGLWAVCRATSARVLDNDLIPILHAADCSTLRPAPGTPDPRLTEIFECAREITALPPRAERPRSDTITSRASYPAGEFRQTYL